MSPFPSSQEALCAPPIPQTHQAGVPTTDEASLEDAARVTVVVATYQAAETLPRCLDSILVQDPPPRDVVVVDDGSTDETWAVLERYAGRVQVIRQENRGEACAKNAGLAAATTGIVAIVDADDVLLPGWMAAVTRALVARPDLSLVATDAWLVVDGQRTRRAYGAGMTFPVAGQREQILRRNFVLGFVAVRRARLLAVGGYDERIEVASDWSAWGRMALRGARFGLIQEPLAEYHLRSHSLSSDRKRLLHGRIDVMERLCGESSARRADRELLWRSIFEARLQLELIEARAALLANAPDARGRLLAVARSNRHGRLSRLKALAVAVFPFWVSRGLVVSSGIRENSGFRGSA